MLIALDENSAESDPHSPQRPELRSHHARPDKRGRHSFRQLHPINATDGSFAHRETERPPNGTERYSDEVFLICYDSFPGAHIIVESMPSMPSLADRPTPDSNPAGQHTVATGNASGSEENERPAHDNFTIMLKWHFVLNFNVEGVQSVIHECHPDMVVDSDPWKEVLRKASHTMRSWKVASLKAMKAQIGSQMLSSNCENPESLVNLTDAETLTHYFYRTFNEEAFYTCFRWTYEIIDLKNSPEVGRNYLRNIWANLAASTSLPDNPRPSRGLHQFSLLRSHTQNVSLSLPSPCFDRVHLGAGP
ncbi:PAK-box/P21-Rho-binding [Penicillium bovifimosum]|uniref:PAK-box/P21-Rho-binding n=1 Tax=Penicillium bovifimosum TaxID=126998 RepID=A0A9W9GIM6_9EURO|nr:PAK-box/P21-Rho-binding [Penicillium bovifimosum]KAJ5120896.1 PAK-box/P21-Rho-binding [Penicillium bovifimosum]